MIISTRFFSLKLSILFFFFILAENNSNAQDYATKDEYDQELNLGAGLGIDYGGFGIRLSFLPEKHLSLFAAGGFNIIGNFRMI